MRRPGQILKSLFSHERRQDKHSLRYEKDTKRLDREMKEHDVSPLVYDARREVAARQKLLIVSPTRTHPAVRIQRRRAKNRVARASRKRNRHLASHRGR